MSPPPTPELALVDLAYQSERGSQDWLREISTLLRGIVPGVVSCYAFEVSREAGRVTLGEHWAESDVVTQQMVKTFAEAPNELLDLFHSSPLLARTTGEVLREAGIDVEGTLLPDMFGTLGIAEQFAVAAHGPSGHGAVLGLCLDNLAGPPPEQRVMLSQIGAHVAAGARLYNHLAGTPAIEQATAILHPDGKLEHGTEDGVAARELIGEAVRRVEYARRHSNDAREALELWQGLVAGRWTLVDHFEGTGRRYYVAMENSSDTASSKALNRREAEVVAYLTSGTGTSATAYALGLDEATVRGYLHTAMTKLGVRSRAELIALRASLLGHAPSR